MALGTAESCAAFRLRNAAAGATLVVAGALAVRVSAIELLVTSLRTRHCLGRGDSDHPRDDSHQAGASGGRPVEFARHRVESPVVNVFFLPFPRPQTGSRQYRRSSRFCTAPCPDTEYPRTLSHMCPFNRDIARHVNSRFEVIPPMLSVLPVLPFRMRDIVRTCSRGCGNRDDSEKPTVSRGFHLAAPVDNSSPDTPRGG